MQIKLFSIPVFSSAKVEEELNVFLRTYQIIDIQREFVAAAENSFWSFCIRFLDQETEESRLVKSKIDYRDLLEDHEFTVFLRLKDIRKQLAEEFAVKVFMVFSNAELAEMSRFEELTVSNVSKIKGIGKKKMENYGVRLIELYNQYEAGIGTV